MYNRKIECLELDCGECLEDLIDKLLDKIKITQESKILGCINGIYLECYKNSTKEELEDQYEYFTHRPKQIRNKRTLIISGFPAIGKSFLFKNKQFKDLNILDSDSSEFSWIKDENGNNTKDRNLDFPNNYINHIKENIGYADIILVSSYEVVRNALKNNKIDYVLVYPYKDCKLEYIKRYIERGNDETFITFINNNWDNFIKDMENEEFPTKLKLSSGKFLSDYINGMLKYCPVYNEMCSVVYTNADEYEGNPCCRCVY